MSHPIGKADGLDESSRVQVPWHAMTARKINQSEGTVLKVLSVTGSTKRGHAVLWLFLGYWAEGLSDFRGEADGLSRSRKAKTPHIAWEVGRGALNIWKLLRTLGWLEQRNQVIEIFMRGIRSIYS